MVPADVMEKAAAANKMQDDNMENITLALVCFVCCSGNCGWIIALMKNSILNVDIFWRDYSKIL